MSSHSKAAAKFIADAPRTAWHDKALFAVRAKRDRMMHEVPEWEALREASSQIKRHTLSHLAHYLEEFERNATANGIVVHWAADADEMNRTVWELVSAHGGKNLIKSKSMLSEECGLTPYLLQRGVDAVDVEYFRDRASIEKILAVAKEHGVTVIMSNHDFDKTPSFDEITGRLMGMKKLGADVAKLACMPNSAKDVLTLLSATEAVKSQYPDEPIITMSMGKLGAISRISGEIFGSALTFGSAKKASAPGQLEVTTLQQILRALH